MLLRISLSRCRKSASSPPAVFREEAVARFLGAAFFEVGGLLVFFADFLVAGFLAGADDFFLRAAFFAEVFLGELLRVEVFFLAGRFLAMGF